MLYREMGRHLIRSYYSHINYEKCGVIRTVDCIVHNWDPASIGMRIENETQQLFSADFFVHRQRQRCWKHSNWRRRTCLARLMATSAMRTLRGRNANGFGWFQTRDGRRIFLARHN